MPKRKIKKPETIIELEDLKTAVNEIKSILGFDIAEEIKDESDIKPVVVVETKNEEDFERKREEPVRLAEDGKIDKVTYLKKANTKVISKIYTEYERKSAKTK